MSVTHSLTNSTPATPPDQKLVGRLSKILTVIATLGLLAAATGLLNHALLGADTSFIEPPATLEQAPDPRLVEISSVGHLPTATDAILIRSLGDPAYDPVIPGTHPPLYFELMLATALDPAFEEVYTYGASILSIVRRDGPGAADLLERAHRLVEQGRFRSSALILEIFRGYNALFETNQLQTAIDAFTAASRLPQAPAYLGGLIENLSSRKGRILIASRTLESLLKRQNDPQTQMAIETRVSQLELAKRLSTVDETFKSWLGSRQGSQILFDRFRGQGHADLRWDEVRGQVETLAPREILKGIY